MRKWTRMLLLGALFTVLLCTSALAAGEDVQGIHSITNSNETAYSVQAQKSGGTVVTTAETVNTESGNLSVYPDTECVKFTINSSVEGQQYLVFVLTEKKAPTSGNIAYIDQKGTGEALTFKLYPNSLTSGQTYYIYVATTSSELNVNNPAATFSYYAPYMLGDVTGDKKVRSNDATRVLNHAAGNIILTGNDFKAGDVIKDGKVRSNDATRILNFAAGNITSFD